MKKKTKYLTKYPDFELIPETSGKISNGIFINEKTNEIIVCFAWGGDYHFKFKELKNTDNT